MMKCDTDTAEIKDTPTLPWSPRVRAIVSVLIALHILALFSAPWSSPPPASELSRFVAKRFEPYLYGAYLNHGYRFFAPNPGASHLVEYELQFADGRTEVGRFPDLKRHWPRLHYHRYLILAEVVHDFTSNIPPEAQRPPPHLPAGIKQQAIADFHEQTAARERAIRRRDLLVESVANGLLAEHDAVKVRLWSVEHEILPPQAIVFGERLDREETYVKRLLGEFQR